LGLSGPAPTKRQQPTKPATNRRADVTDSIGPTELRDVGTRRAGGRKD